MIETFLWCSVIFGLLFKCSVLHILPSVVFKNGIAELAGKVIHLIISESERQLLNESKALVIRISEFPFIFHQWLR